MARIHYRTGEHPVNDNADRVARMGEALGLDQDDVSLARDIAEVAKLFRSLDAEQRALVLALARDLARQVRGRPGSASSSATPPE